MIVIRPMKRSDQEALGDFPFESLLGMVNLPRNPDKLLEKIIHSEQSFVKKVSKPTNEEYYFVLEDLTTGRVGGTCGILAHSGSTKKHNYKIKTYVNPYQHPDAPKEIKTLEVISCNQNASEICALYLQPSFRHSGQGRLLSLSRFLFMAAFPERFREMILAELRGYIDASQVSPFWEGIGRHFCNLSFVELMAKIEMNEEVPQILPAYPIYISLLPKDTQEAIGKTHDSSKPAYRMLCQENFTFLNEIDLYEGGPVLSCTASKVRSIKDSALIKVKTTHDTLVDDPEYILANEKLNFRACFSSMRIISKSEALISQDALEALQIKNGDKIRYVLPHEKIP